jgi:PAS domain-containing protein
LTQSKTGMKPDRPNLSIEGIRNFLAAIIASSDDAIISKDLNGIINSWNDGARRIFGYEAEEMVGQCQGRNEREPPRRRNWEPVGG